MRNGNIPTACCRCPACSRPSRRLAGLLEKARAAGAPIVHVRHQSKGKAFNPSSSGYEIVSPLTPRAGETIVDKGLPNAFAGTDLAKHLAASSRKNLIVGGFMTHMCVSATVRSATDNGFMSTVAADTVATRDLPDATGGVDDHRRRHQPHHAGRAVRSLRLGRAQGDPDLADCSLCGLERPARLAAPGAPNACLAAGSIRGNGVEIARSVPSRRHSPVPARRSRRWRTAA